MLLIAIACAAFLSTFAGGLLAFRLHDKLHLILGFSAGAVIGVSFFDLLPEAIHFAAGPGEAATILAWAASGFLAYLTFDRALQFHGAQSATGHPEPVERHAAIGPAVLCVHSLLDGIAIGLAFQASRAIGLVVTIAVLSHDFSDGINTMSLVLKSGGGRRRAMVWLGADALAPALGIGIATCLALPHEAFGFMLALFGGFFLYIGASELIPESYHAHPKFLTTAMTLAGAALLYLSVRLVAGG